MSLYAASGFLPRQDAAITKHWLPEEVDLLLAKQGVSKEPVNIASLAMKLGMTRIVEKPLRGAGALVPGGHGFTIVVNVNQVHTRQRFTIAHELAHVLLAPDSKIAWRKGPTVADKRLESYCDLLAADLLMPLSRFRQQLRRLSSCTPHVFMTVKNLANIFDVSLTAAAIRFVEAVEEPCVLVVSSREKSSGKWKVGWFRQNTLDRHGNPKHFIRPGTHFPVWTTAHIGPAHIDMGSLSGTYYVESHCFGAAKRYCALTLIFPQRTS
ncbi:MAG: ImmA/IrrE family metallo-endopeptidase [Chloroflexi bacterium]|nr:ImmA/IrrE family metallo-endopeptidase [Chloroflexota bacterium]